ncbi:MAG: M14 family zinc carboxypeptidase [Gemmatimonadota bacterium]
MSGAPRRRGWPLSRAAAPLAASAVLLAAAPRAPAAQQSAATGVRTADLPRTRAERTGYAETTRYAEVLDFLARIAPLSERLHVTTFGYTNEGRALPLVVFGDVADAGPAAVRATGRLRVLVMADIHAGEVCGKEAALVLLRDLATGGHAEWADSLVLLVAPIYNADGNERIDLRNRRLQNGPVGGMGQRPNARGLDLNRDHTKLESPEARSLVRLLRAYDPHVVIDLHTTNGTVHAYHLTYSPPLNPDTPAEIDALLREDWLPNVVRAIRETEGWELHDYGNVPSTFQREGAEGRERGWYTYDPRPRFSTNYVGLRNRFGILSEAYAYAPFEERIRASLRFVEELTGWAGRNAGKIRAATRAADARSVVGEPLTLRAAPARSEAPATILLGEVEDLRNPYTGERMLGRLDVRRPERMPEFVAFEPVESARAPAAYLVPQKLGGVLALLEAHGVRTLPLAAPLTARAEVFRIDSTRVAEREFQGHLQRELWGGYEVRDETFPPGTVLVPVDQPLGRLAFTLLEPRAPDGVVNWNLLDDALGGESPAAAYPIARLPALPAGVCASCGRR